MPNLAAVLKDEIRRLARREANALMSSHKKASAQYRRDIAALKRQIAEQQKRIENHVARGMTASDRA